MADETTDLRARTAAGRAAVALGVAVGAFVAAVLLARLAVTVLRRVVGLTPGPDVGGLLVSVLIFQGLAIPVVAAGFLRADAPAGWRSYLRLERPTAETVFHGTVVAFGTVVVLGAGTAAATFAGVAPAESSGSERTDLAYFVAAFLVSTFLAAPMEDLFFRGVIRRHLADRLGAAVGIGVASLLFVPIHAGVSGTDGGRLVTLGVFAGIGVGLGVGYHYGGNPFVPVVGHALFNAVQILLRVAELLA